MTPQSLRGSSAPIRLLPHLPPVLECGLRVAMAPYVDRVTILGPGEDHDLVLFDPMLDQLADRLSEADHVPRVALTGSVGPHVAELAQHLGAVRVLELSCPASGMLSVIEGTVDDHAPQHRVYGPHVTEFGGPLTVREAEVLALVCQGLTNHEISAELFLGINTIKTYIRTAYRKMGVRSRSQAVLWGLERGADSWAPSRLRGSERPSAHVGGQESAGTSRLHGPALVSGRAVPRNGQY